MAGLLALAVLPSHAADTIPSQLADADYWKMISEFSEPGGSFQLEIITSNEVSYQYAMPELMKQFFGATSQVSLPVHSGHDGGAQSATETHSR